MKDLLPIGSVVTLKEGKKKLMIIGRLQENMDANKVYDYAGCQWPEGYMDKDHCYVFNHEDIDCLNVLGALFALIGAGIMIVLFLSFLLGISTLVSRVWMLLLFATVCFHACGLDSGTVNMFSDTFTLVAYIVITVIVLFAQTIIGWLVGMCYYISESAMMF